MGGQEANPNPFTLNKFGAWAVEGVGSYLFAAIAVLLIGPGKYAVRPDQQ